MNVNKKAHSLYQSMDRWILLYRRIHECDHNTAHDALDEMADKLTGAAADQSTPQFQEAVDASFEEMKAKHPETVQVEAMVMTSQGKIDRLTVTPIGDVRGGPLLELPHESRSANRSMASTNIREDWKNTKWSEPGQRPGMPPVEAAPFGGPILDTGKDPLAFTSNDERRALEQQGYGNARPKMTTEETRVHVERIISEQERLYASLTDELEMQLVKGNIESARRRLVMLDEVEAREKERKGTLSLPRK